MKDITLAVITRLKANTTLCHASYVGASPNQRIYRASLPVSPTFPCVVVNLIDTKRMNIDHSGSRIAQSRIQVTAFADKDVDAATISDLIANDLNRAADVHLGYGVQAIRIDDGGVRPEPVAGNLGKYLYHRDFLIQHYY